MDEQIDHGGIIGQKEVTVSPKDTSLEIYNKVIEAEKELIKEHIISIIDEDYTLHFPNERVIIME